MKKGENKKGEKQACRNEQPRSSKAKREQKELEQITKRHRSEQHQVLRARIVLEAARDHSNAQIARELAINVDTVRVFRDRWVGLQGIDLESRSHAERLHDAPRPGSPPKITVEQHCQIAAVARRQHR